MNRKTKILLGVDIFYLAWVTFYIAFDTDKTTGFWEWVFIIALFPIGGIWPLWRWRKYWRTRHATHHGWSAGDKVVVVGGRRGVLCSHPASLKEAVLTEWVVNFDDGTQETLHYLSLKGPSVVDRLGDLVRMVRA